MNRNGLVLIVRRKRVSRTHRRLLGAALVSAAALTALVTSPDALLTWVSDIRSRPSLFALVVAALYLGRPLVAWPISLCSAVVGYGYGLWGVPLALCGVGVTCLPPYLLGRYMEADSGILGSLGCSGERFFEATGGFRGVVAARLAPLPADPVSCGAGLSGVDLREYLSGTLVGEVPWTVAAVLVGSSLSRLAVGRIDGVSVEFTLTVCALSIALLASPVHEYLRERRRGHQKVSEQS